MNFTRMCGSVRKSLQNAAGRQLPPDYGRHCIDRLREQGNGWLHDILKTVCNAGVLLVPYYARRERREKLFRCTCFGSNVAGS